MTERERREDEHIDVVFILSDGHSGSTLLDVLLSQQEGVMGLGEVEKFGHKASVDYVFCACGETVAQCDFWHDFMKDHNAYIQKKVRLIRMKPRYFFSSRRKYTIKTVVQASVSLDEYLRNNQELFEYASRKSGAQLLIDSSKNIVRTIFFRHDSTKVRPYVIFLTRDGRGVTWSFMRKYPNSCSVAFMTSWAMTNIKALLALWRYRIPFIHVRYEDIVHSPDRTLRRIAQMAPIAGDHFEGAPKDSQLHHQVAGNAPVLETKDLKLQEDLRWRTDMPKCYQWLFLLLFGWLNLLLGHGPARKE